MNVYLNQEPTESFVGKEGLIENNIYLLKFKYKQETVENNNNLVLLQNKNGNPIIQLIYGNELKNINHVDWGTCKNPIKKI